MWDSDAFELDAREVRLREEVVGEFGDLFRGVTFVSQRLSFCLFPPSLKR